MCEIMQSIVDAEVREAIEKNTKAVTKEVTKNAIKDLIKLGIPKEKILGLGHKEELYEEAVSEMTSDGTEF